MGYIIVQLCEDSTALQGSVVPKRFGSRLSERLLLTFCKGLGSEFDSGRVLECLCTCLEVGAKVYGTLSRR